MNNARHRRRDVGPRCELRAQPELAVSNGSQDSARVIGGIVAAMSSPVASFRAQPELAVNSARVIVAIVAAMSALVASFALSRSWP